jgi:hypothetical protein
MICGAPIPNLSGGSLTPRQLAERWQIAERTLRDWNRRRVVPFFKLGGKEIRYAVVDVEAFELKMRHAARSRSAPNLVGRETVGAM